MRCAEVLESSEDSERNWTRQLRSLCCKILSDWVHNKKEGGGEPDYKN